jgi:hypothetical protein
MASPYTGTRTDRDLARLRAAEAKNLMETEDLSLRHAARRAHTDPRTVLKTFPKGFGRDGRRWVARPDKEPFQMRVVSTSGVVERTTRGSNTRSLISRHHNAVRTYLRPDGGDPGVLRPFEGKHVAGVELQTDPDALVELWLEGQLDFLEIYVSH